jgi:hypothetical protein
MSDNKLILRSYRLAFEVERRIHRVDRFRIPVPYGIPLVALGYWAVVMVVFLVAGALPVLGTLLSALPWPLRLILLPGLVTRALCHKRADGRPAHEAITAYFTFLLSTKHLVGLAVAPHEDGHLDALAVAGDEHGARFPRGVVRGPCTVLLRRPARVEVRARVVSVVPLVGDELRDPQEVVLPAGSRMEVTV